MVLFVVLMGLIIERQGWIKNRLLFLPIGLVCGVILALMFHAWWLIPAGIGAISVGVGWARGDIGKLPQ